MKDPTEAARRRMVETDAPARDLAAHTGETWNAEELHRDFDVICFLAPFVLVRRKADGKTGALEFTHRPRVYFDWQEDR